MALTVCRIANAEEAAEWDRYVLRHPKACGYHLIDWRGVIETAFGHETFYLMAKDAAGRVHGVLPLVFLSSRIFGRFLISMPFFNYGGILADTAEAGDVLVAKAVEIGGVVNAGHIELREQDRINLPWPVKRNKVSMRLDLQGNFEGLWKRFTSKVRSQVRRAQKEGMTVRIEGMQVLDDFYDVFSRTMRDHGTPVYGMRFFEVILQKFPSECQICIVYLRGRPMAACLLYGFRQTLEIPWASSDRRYSRLAPNMLLYSSALEYGCHQGFQIFDFGRSTYDSGTYRFKAQWGARPIPLHWYYWLKEGSELPELNPQNRKYRLAIETWKQLPVSISRIVGPRIVKYLP